MPNQDTVDVERALRRTGLGVELDRCYGARHGTLYVAGRKLRGQAAESLAQVVQHSAQLTAQGRAQGLQC